MRKNAMFSKITETFKYCLKQCV